MRKESSSASTRSSAPVQVTTLTPDPASFSLLLFFVSLGDKSDDQFLADIFAVGVSIVFGAIHCKKWSFHFTTLQERWAWRISVILILGLPIPIVPLGHLSEVFDTEENKITWMELCWSFINWTGLGMICLYTIAQIVLLILHCTLRSPTRCTCPA